MLTIKSQFVQHLAVKALVLTSKFVTTTVCKSNFLHNFNLYSNLTCNKLHIFIFYNILNNFLYKNVQILSDFKIIKSNSTLFFIVISVYIEYVIVMYLHMASEMDN